MLSKVTKLLPVGLLAFPALALAQGQTVQTILVKFQDILRMVIPIIITLAIIFFLWGLTQYVTSAGDEAKRKEAATKIIGGIVVIFVMVTVWGLVYVLGRSFGIEPGSQNLPVPVPEVPSARF